MYQIHEEEFIKKIEEFKNSFEEEQQKDLQLNLQNIPDNQINIPEINQIYKSNIENIRLIKVKIEKFINSYNDSIPKNDFKIIDIENDSIIDMKTEHKGRLICIKKINHPIYGQSLISSSQDKTLKLWI